MALFASAQFQKQLKQLCVYHPAVSVLNLQHDVESKHLTRNTNLEHRYVGNHPRAVALAMILLNMATAQGRKPWFDYTVKLSQVETHGFFTPK